MPEKENLSLICIGIFLISSSTLIFEISMTRVFSITLWHHLAYMIISIALLGYGVSGTLLTVFPKLLKLGTDRFLVLCCALYSLTVLLGFAVTNHIPFDPFQILWSRTQLLYLFLYYVTLTVPYIFSGLIVGAALLRFKGTGFIYGSSMIGSSTGGVLAIASFTMLTGPQVIVLASLIGAVAMIFFSLRQRNLRDIALTATILIIGLIAILQPLALNISPYKALNLALNYPGAHLVLTEWNSISRVDVVESNGIRYAPGLSLTYQEHLPKQIGITVDAGNLNAVTDHKNLKFLDYMPIAVPYRINKNPSVLVMGAGGGLEVLNALENNATSIDVVEKNPLLIEIVKDRYDRFSGEIYNNDKVTIIVEDERSYVHRTKKRYDLIGILTTDNVISGTTGVYSQSENYIYTRDAFEEYIERLNDNGIISVTRWLHHPPRESIRTFVLAYEALRKKGTENPEEHIVAFRTITTYTILIKKAPFSPEEVGEVKKFLKDKKFDIIWAPGITEDGVNIYNKFPEPVYYRTIKTIVTSSDRERYYENYLFDISPVTDDMPYFFNFFKWNRIKELYESMGEKWEPFFEGGFMVFAVFIQAFILSAVLILVPLLTVRKLRASSRFRSRLLSYFFLIGLAYMFVEITLIQKFILFLGHPIYAISLVLAALLFFSGIGSLVSERLSINRLGTVLAVLSISILTYILLLPYVFSVTLGQRLIIRCIISVVVIAPLGVLMGVPFPVGMRVTRGRDKKLIPWGWGVNGCASVLGSVLAVIIAITFGFKAVLLGASLSYLISLIFVSSVHRRS